MLMIPARLVRSESFWAIVKVRSPHTGREPGYPRTRQPLSSLLVAAPGVSLRASLCHSEMALA